MRNRSLKCSVTIVSNKFKRLVPPKDKEVYIPHHHDENLVQTHDDTWEAKDTDTSEYERRGKIFKKKKKVSKDEVIDKSK